MSTHIPGPTARLDPAQRTADGKAARRRAPLESHAEFPPAPDRDPVGLLLRQDESRVPTLVPVRHGRMLVSPFAFFRGAALPMAADLAATPSSGLRVQLCGDAHLSNFGAFGSPERRLVFDLNDFDETLPGPFEWDVKRLVASMSVAGRERGLSGKQRRTVAVATGAAYREAMRQFAQMPVLQVWYTHIDVEDALARFGSDMPKKAVRATKAQIAKARTRDNTQALAKLTTVVDGERIIVSNPPLIVPIEELAGDVDVEATYRAIRQLLRPYSRRLPPDRRGLLQRFTLTRIARKVVGVGSVGTQAWILLMEPDDGLEPLLLQAKQASESALAAYAGASEYANHGERVVTGQRKMQATGDIFLGWQRVRPVGGGAQDYYIRQLRDWKFAVDIGRLAPEGLASYGRLCGWTLARAHARTGDRMAIAGYLGKSDRFERAVAEFAEAYADQTERDHAALEDAVDSGRVTAVRGI
jgi:uncharacterized protein (DUF2252 family)